MSSNVKKAQRKISTKNFRRTTMLNRTKSKRKQRVKSGFKDQKVKKEEEMKEGSGTIMTWIWLWTLKLRKTRIEETKIMIISKIECLKSD